MRLASFAFCISSKPCSNRRSKQHRFYDQIKASKPQLCSNENEKVPLKWVYELHLHLSPCDMLPHQNLHGYDADFLGCYSHSQCQSIAAFIGFADPKSLFAHEIVPKCSAVDLGFSRARCFRLSAERGVLPRLGAKAFAPYRSGKQSPLAPLNVYQSRA